MGRYLIFLALLFEIAVISLLVGTLTGQPILETTALAGIERFVCESDEFLLSSTDSSYVCIDNEYIERDVTGITMRYLVGAVVTGILLGVLLINIGGNMLRREREAKNNPFDGQNLSDIAEVYQDGVQVSMQQLRVNKDHIPPEALAIMKTVLGEISNAFDGGSLSERLQQLEEARQQGLISQAEYDRVRQAILDSMDD